MTKGKYVFFFGGIREKVVTMGYDRKIYYLQIRLTLVEGKVFFKADIKKKEGGKVEEFAY